MAQKFTQTASVPAASHRDRTANQNTLKKAFLLVATLFCFAAAGSAQSSASNPQGGLQGPDHYKFRVGDVEITSLSDGSVPQDLHVLLHDTTVAHTDQLLHDGFLTDPTEASINAFVFKTAGKVVLVDAGSGDFFGPGYGGKLLESLASIHVSPDEITDVLLTHAHDDHMGGLVHNGKLDFPNAVVHLSAAELAFFLDRSNAARAHYAMSYFDQAFAALKPEQDAGKISTFQSGEEIIPGVRATVHPGHTPGSTFYELRSHGQSIIFVGDIIHCEAVQLPDPNITIIYDVDSVKAAAVRRDTLASFAKDRTLIAVPHLPFPGVGHIKLSGKGYEWVPVLYENRDFASGATFQDPHKNGDRLDPGPAQYGSLESKNKAIVLEAIDTLFNKRDYAAAERFWSPDYIQHNAHVAPGRDGLFNLAKSLPPTAKYEVGTIVAEGDFVIVHGRVSGLGQPANWIVADILHIKDGVLVEHWDVIEDEATQEQSKSGRPMFGDSFPR